MPARLFTVLGALLATAAVTLGAYGAHGLRGRFDADSAAVWHTAVEYHLFHALGLLIVGLIAQRGRATRLIELSGWLMVCGVFLFCGSLYALALSAPRMLGFLTPIGGLAFIAAWLLLAAAAWRAR